MKNVTRIRDLLFGGAYLAEGASWRLGRLRMTSDVRISVGCIEMITRSFLHSTLPRDRYFFKRTPT
jgi:hypothetical protein